MPAVNFRTAAPSDAAAMARVDGRSWPAELAPTASQCLARILAYPPGQLLAETDGRVVGTSSAQRISEEFLAANAHRYDLITDADRFTRSHRDDGEIYQLVGVGVLPEARGLHLGRRLVDRQIAFARGLSGIRRIVGFTRPAGYHRHQQMTIEDYVHGRKKHGRPLDPVIAFHVEAGARIVSIHPEFRPDDRQACGYGVLIEYRLE